MPFTTGNPFLGTNLLGFSIGRGSGALKGLSLEPDFHVSTHLRPAQPTAVCILRIKTIFPH